MSNPETSHVVLIAHTWQQAAREAYKALTARYSAVTLLSWSALAGRQVDLEASFPMEGEVLMLSPEGHDMTALLLMERAGLHLSLDQYHAGSLLQWPALQEGWQMLWDELVALAERRPALRWEQLVLPNNAAPAEGWQAGAWEEAPDRSLLLWQWPATAWRLPAIWGRKTAEGLHLHGYCRVEEVAVSAPAPGAKDWLLQPSPEAAEIPGGIDLVNAIEKAGARSWYGSYESWPPQELQEEGAWPQAVRAGELVTGKAVFPPPFTWQRIQG